MEKESLQEKKKRFAKQFTDCEQSLFAYILVLTPNYCDALDILQNAVVAMWSKYDQLETPDSFKVWARKFAYLEVLKYREKKSYRGWMLNPFDEEMIGELIHKHEIHQSTVEVRDQALESCLKKLTPQDQTLLYHRYWKNTNLKDLASDLGLSNSQVYSRLDKLRRNLQKCINHTLAVIGE